MTSLQVVHLGTEGTFNVETENSVYRVSLQSSGAANVMDSKLKGLTGLLSSNLKVGERMLISSDNSSLHTSIVKSITRLDT